MPPPSQTDRIRRAYSAWAFVSAYGIDGVSRALPSELAGHIRLHADSFFKHLYVARLEDEQYILSFLRSGAMSLWIKGHVGNGKTTLVHKVIREYNEEYRLPFVGIDFRVDDLHLDDRNEIDTPIRNLLERCVLTYIRGENLDRRSLACTFCRSRFDQLLSSGEAQRIFQDLYELYRLRTGKSLSDENDFYDWTLAHSQPGSPALDDDVARLIASLSQVLTLQDQLFAIANVTVRPERRRIVILFDNVDGIEDITVRRALKLWLRSEAEKFKSVAYFVACLRPENEDHFLYRDQVQTAGEAVFGEGASVIMTISLEPGEMTSEDLRQYEALERGRFFDPEDEVFVDLDSSTPMGRRRAFDDIVQQRRVNFLAGLAEGNPLPGIEKTDIATIARACREILSVRSVNRDIQMLANGNRRDLLVGVANFLEYLVRDLKLDWERIGVCDTDEDPLVRRGTAIKSLYYKWLASGQPKEEHPPVFDVDAYNPVNWVEEAGWQGNVLKPRDVGEISTLVYALRRQFILASIYNLSGNTVSEKYREKVPVSALISRCAPLGLEDTVVLATTTDIIQAGPVRFHGLLETTNFLRIYEGKDSVSRSDDVTITDRGCRLLEQTGSSFNFLVELLIRRSRRLSPTFDGKDADAAAGATWHQRGAIEQEPAALTVDWIRRGLTTELRVLELFSAGLWKSERRKDWLATYRKRFCIWKSHRGTTMPALWMQRIARSAVAYLGHAAELLESNDRTELESLVAELEDLDNYVDRLLRDNRLDLVPRDRPLIVR